MLAQVSRTLVRAFHSTFELTLLVGMAMVHVHVLARRGFFRLLLRAVELLPGEIWCAHASMIVLC